jgi:hypothetical protein
LPGATRKIRKLDIGRASRLGFFHVAVERPASGLDLTGNLSIPGRASVSTPVFVLIIHLGWEEVGQECRRLGERRASFEASLRKAPQDEV